MQQHLSILSFIFCPFFLLCMDNQEQNPLLHRIHTLELNLHKKFVSDLEKEFTLKVVERPRYNQSYRHSVIQKALICIASLQRINTRYQEFKKCMDFDVPGYTTLENIQLQEPKELTLYKNFVAQIDQALKLKKEVNQIHLLLQEFQYTLTNLQGE